MLSTNTPNTIRSGRRTTLTIASLALVFLISLVATVTALQAAGPGGEMSLVSTPAAVARTNAGDCLHRGPQAICQEICLNTPDGHVIPQGNFVCVDP